MADKIKVYRTYEFMDKDPVIEEVKGMVEKERLLKKPGIIQELSGVSRATIHNWFYGETRRPQYSTVMAVVTALGYRVGFKHEQKLNVEVERRAAAKWRARQEARKQAAKEKLIAQRKAARASNSAERPQA